MAGPFGKAPSLAEYVHFAKDFGCVVKSGYMDVDGDVVFFNKLTMPNGRFYIDTSPTQTERLSPSTVARMDRRLGLDSPFPKVPEAGGREDS